MPPCTFDWRPPALDFLKSVCSTIILPLLSHMGLIYSRAMAIDFINQPNYYTETSTHSSLLAFGAVKTIRTLRFEPPQSRRCRTKYPARSCRSSRCGHVWEVIFKGAVVRVFQRGCSDR